MDSVIFVYINFVLTRQNICDIISIHTEVVRWHHRLQAAKELKLKLIPVEKVSLPYKGYKTIFDLLWFD